MAVKYKDSIQGFAALEKSLDAAIPKQDGSSAGQLPSAASSEADSMLAALSKVSQWAAPVSKGRRVYDDKEFFESLSKQRASGRILSDRQLAALRKLSGKYAKQDDAGEQQ